LVSIQKFKSYTNNKYEKNFDYTSPFHRLLDNSTTKIYQTYPQRFRSQTGVAGYRTPYIMNANSRGKRIFEKLLDWVEV